MNITIVKNGQKIGPFDETQVSDMLKTGMIQASDLGWTEGMDAWQPLSSFGHFQTQESGPPPVPIYPASGSPERKRSALPVVSLSMGIISLLCIPSVLFNLPGLLVILAVPAIICGHIARGKLKKRNERKGMGIALSGAISGYIAILGFVAVAMISSFNFTMQSAKESETANILVDAAWAVRQLGYEKQWTTTEEAILDLMNGIELNGKKYSAEDLAEVNVTSLQDLRQGRVDPRPYLRLENGNIEYSLSPPMQGNLTRPAYSPNLKSERSKSTR